MEKSLLATLVLVLLIPGTSSGQTTFVWTPVSPDEASRQGWTPEGLEAVQRFTDSIGTSAFIVLTGGQAVAAAGDLSHLYRAHSIRKSLLSALIGIAIGEGQVDSTATLAELAVSDRGGLSPDERRATVLQLLQSRSGVYHPAASETADMRESRPQRGSHDPGTFWYYNNWDFNALGTIYALRTGKTIGDGFSEKIAVPIGMEDYEPSHVELHREPTSSNHASYRFRLSARDLARFGNLFLHKGAWGSSSVVPETWVTTSTALHSTTEQSGTKGGYGLMWWVTVDDDSGLPVGSFTASGSGGQRLTVLPEIETVVVHMMDTDLRSGPRIGTSTYNRLLARILAARTR